MGGIIDDGALDQRIREIARQEAQRPALVNQRTVETIVGLPRTLYLDLARAGAFPSTKVQRLIVARTADVLGYFEARFQLLGPKVAPVNEPQTPEARAFARVGARRVAPSGTGRGGRS